MPRAWTAAVKKVWGQLERVYSLDCLVDWLQSYVPKSTLFDRASIHLYLGNLAVPVVLMLLCLAPWPHQSSGDWNRFLAVHYSSLSLVAVGFKLGVPLEWLKRLLPLAFAISAINVFMISGGLDSPFLLFASLPFYACNSLLVGAWRFATLSFFMGSLLYIAYWQSAGYKWHSESSEQFLADQRFFMVLASSISAHRMIHMFSKNMSSVVKALRDDKLELSSMQKMQTEFMAIVFHEVRNPLHVIRGVTTKLMEDVNRSDTPADLHQEFQMLDFCSNQMLRILDDVLDVAKLQAGLFQLECTPFNIRSVVESVCRQYNAKLSPGVNMNFAVQGMVPETVKGDPMRVNQVVGNLVSNACKFTSEGEVNVVLSCRSIDTDKPEQNTATLTVTVNDTGDGLSEAEHRTLFHQYRQGQSHKNSKSKHKGTGLGLYIVKGLTEAMGGTVSASSAGKGKGSTFFVSFTLGVTNKALEEVFGSNHVADPPPQHPHLPQLPQSSSVYLGSGSFGGTTASSASQTKATPRPHDFPSANPANRHSSFSLLTRAEIAPGPVEKFNPDVLELKYECSPLMVTRAVDRNRLGIGNPSCRPFNRAAAKALRKRKSFAFDELLDDKLLNFEVEPGPQPKVAKSSE